MAEYCTTPSSKGGSNNKSRVVGVACVPSKTTATIRGLDRSRISVGRCQGVLDRADPVPTLHRIQSVIDNAIHVSVRPVDYSDLVCIVVNIPGEMNERYAQAFVRELKRLEPRLAGAQIFVVSDLEAEMHRISNGGPGFLIISGRPDRGYGQNALGECDRVAGPGLGDQLAWQSMHLIVKSTNAGAGFAALEGRFFDHFGASSKRDLDDIIGFSDPIERTSIKDEILSIVAEEAAADNPLALGLCTATARSYCALSERIVSSLHLGPVIFPISPRGGLFTVNPIFGRLYLSAMKHIAPNAYLADICSEIGESEALMAIDLYLRLKAGSC